MNFWKLILPLLLASSALAENAGLSFYGMSHKDWPCSNNSAFSGIKTPRLAVLWTTFGSKLECIKRFTALPKPHLLELHLLNEVGHRNNRLGDYEFLHPYGVEKYRELLETENPAFMQKLRSHFQTIRSQLDRIITANTKLYISPGLESNLTCAAAVNLLSLTKEVFGDRAKIVWNPAGINRFCNHRLGDYVFEQHDERGDGQAPCIQNMDGLDLALHGEATVFPSHALPADELPEFFNRHRNCDAAFVWSAPMNGIKSAGTFVDPRKRTGWVTASQAVKLNKILREAEAPPIQPPPWSEEDKVALRGCKKVFKVKDGPGHFLWKPESDTQPGSVALFDVPAVKAASLHKGKRKLGDMRFSGVGNGERQHWRYPVKGQRLPFNIVLKTERGCYPLSNPKQRND